MESSNNSRDIQNIEEEFTINNFGKFTINSNFNHNNHNNFGNSNQQYENLYFPRVWSTFRKNHMFYDGIIQLSTNGKRIKIHRAILSGSSSYFRACFMYEILRNKNHNSLATPTQKNEIKIENKSNKYQEIYQYHRNYKRLENDDHSRKDNDHHDHHDHDNDGNLSTITVDLPESILEQFLDYAYTGKCEITWDNIQQLLPYADQYDFIGIVELCCKFLLNELNSLNCIGIYLFAKDHLCYKLENQVKQFIIMNFYEIFEKSNELVQFNDANDLYQILNDDYLTIKSEDIVLQVIKKWIEFNENEREKYLNKLLLCVRFGLVKSDTFKNVFMKWKLIKNNPEIQKTILPLSYKTRIPYQIIMVVGGWINGAPTDIIEVYDTQADIWLKMRYTDSKRAYHGMCTVNKKVYVIGGFDGDIHFNTVKCYDPVTYKWEEKACMHYSRCYVSVAVLDDNIYAIGGYDGRNRLNSVERYDPNRNQWDVIAPMRFHRSDAAATASKKHIFVVGGFNGNDVLNSCEMYDPIMNRWTLLSFMQSPRSGLGLVICNNYLYAIGGHNGQRRLNTVERYSPYDINSQWIDVKEMRCTRSNFSVVVLDDLIYVIGGFNGTRTINIVENFDPNTNIWKFAKQLNTNRSAHTACVLEGLPNTKGYSVYCKDVVDAPCTLEKYEFSIHMNTNAFGDDGDNANNNFPYTDDDEN